MTLLTLLIMSAVPMGELTSHADAILALQLPDGAIIHARTGDEIAIVPYFGNQAALGLFEAYRVTDDKKYLDGAIAWTDWYLRHMNPDGTIAEYRGTTQSYQSLPDTANSVPAAATFLRCANTRRILTHDRSFLLREQARLWAAYELLLARMDYDGLAFADAGTDTKLTVYNAEVFEGLWHARQMARSLRDYDWNSEIYYARRKLENAFDALRAEDGLYAWGKVRNGEMLSTGGSGAFDPAGLANLATVASGPVSKSEARQTLARLQSDYPDLTGCSPGQLFWWVAAAKRCGDDALAARALAQLEVSVEPESAAASHAYCVRALAMVKGKKPRTFGVPMGSTYISYQRPAVR